MKKKKKQTSREKRAQIEAEIAAMKEKSAQLEAYIIHCQVKLAEVQRATERKHAELEKLTPKKS